MSTPQTNVPDPGLYWPEAEALLDGHFRRKRRRRILLWFFLLMGLVSSWMYVQERRSDTHDALQSVTTLQNPQGAAPIEQYTSSASNEANNPTLPAQTEIAAQSTSTNKTGFTETQHVADRATSPAITEKRRTQSESRIPQRKKQPQPAISGELTFGSESKAEQIVSGKTSTAEDSYFGISDDQPAAQSAECEDATTGQEPVIPLAVFSTDSAVSAVAKATTDSNTVLTIPTRPAHSGWLVRAGLSQTRADFYGEVDPGYIDRRRLEETPCLSPALSVQWFRTRGNWDIRIGAGVAQWGEESAYSPYTRQKYTNTTSTWQPYNYTLVDTDSAYVYGMLFYQTSNVLVNDSVLVTSTDTVFGLLPDSSLSESLPCVKHTLVQIPIDLAWTRRIGKFGIGVHAGIRIGFLVRSSGSYLRADQTGLAEWNKKGKGGMFMQAGAGLEFSYRIRERISILLIPSGSTSLTPVQEPLGLKKRYSTWGLQTGLRFVLQ